MNHPESEASDGHHWTILLFRTAAILFLLSAIFVPTNEYQFLTVASGLLGIFLLILSWSIESAKSSKDRDKIDFQPLLDRLDRIAIALEHLQLSISTANDISSPSEENPVKLPGLLGELKVAQEVGDTERVLQIRDTIVTVSSVETMKEIDSGVSKWFMSLIMKRLRTGQVSSELADLAGRVSERFGQTVEGASLRASLPTLRRSAGLCARCSRPYRGISDACPICLAGPPLTLAPSESAEEIEEVEKMTRFEDSPFINVVE